jgi:hypothetical protein
MEPAVLSQFWQYFAGKYNHSTTLLGKRDCLTQRLKDYAVLRGFNKLLNQINWPKNCTP